MIKGICDSFPHYLTQKQEESPDSSHPPSEKTPLLPDFVEKTPSPKPNNNSFIPPLLKPIPRKPPLNPDLINKLILRREDSLEFSSSSDSPSILSESVLAPPVPIKDVDQNPDNRLKKRSSPTTMPTVVLFAETSKTTDGINDHIVKLEALRKKILSKLIKPAGKSDFVFDGMYSDKVRHIFSCESDLSDWEEEFSNLLETPQHLSIKNLLIKLDRVDFIK